MNKNNNSNYEVAAIQMASGPIVSANLLEAKRLISMAASSGAKLVVLPENFAIMGMEETDKVKIREKEGEGQIQEFLQEQCEKNDIWIVGGTIPLMADDDKKIRAACILYDNNGKQVVRYDKTHIFDVHLPESNDRYVESETIEAGDKCCVQKTPFGNIGIAVCYDLRFPELFRSMLDYDVEVIAIPSAFTAKTGRSHWDVLVRSRAIENLSYVIAADQGGYHVNGRESYGDSMIIDPWGNVLDRLPSGSGVVMASIDRKALHKIRQSFPVLSHRTITCKV